MVPGFDQTQVEKMQFLKVFQNINWKSKPMNRHWDNFIFWNFFLSPFAVIAPKLFFVALVSSNNTTHQQVSVAAQLPFKKPEPPPVGQLTI